MKKQHSGNSRLFFIEFLIVLFFFLIISTVCLKLFVKAHQITQHAEDLSHAQTLAASAAELLLSGYDMQEIQEICETEFSCSSDDFSEQSEQAVYHLLITNLTDSSAQLEAPDLTDAQSENETQAANETQSANESTLTNTYCISICKTAAVPIYELTVTVHSPLTQKEVLP